MKTTIEGVLSAGLFGLLMFGVMVLGLCYEEAFVALRVAVFGQ